MTDANTSQSEDQSDNVYISVIRNKLKAVKKILKSDPSAANQIYENQTLLDFPCRHGNFEMAKLLI